MKHKVVKSRNVYIYIKLIFFLIIIFLMSRCSCIMDQGVILNYGDYNIQCICLFDERFYLVKVIILNIAVNYMGILLIVNKEE
ncbi:hypothetical protein, partial [Plasmodium yoelii yoelii]